MVVIELIAIFIGEYVSITAIQQLSVVAVTLSLQHAQADKTISDIANLDRSLNVSNRQLVRVLKTLCDESILEHPKKGLYLVKRKPEFSYKLSAER